MAPFWVEVGLVGTIFTAENTFKADVGTAQAGQKRELWVYNSVCLGKTVTMRSWNNMRHQPKMVNVKEESHGDVTI